MVHIWLAARGLGGEEWGEAELSSLAVARKLRQHIGRGRGSRDPVHVPEHRLNLFAVAAGNHWFEGLNWPSGSADCGL